MQELDRAVALRQTLIDAREWRETFEEYRQPSHAVVEFSEVAMKADIQADRLEGFDGDLNVPRDLAIEMLKWLESQCGHGLKSLGIEVPE